MSEEPIIDLQQLEARVEWVRALARSLVQDRDLAEDVAQEAWMAAVRRPPRSQAALPAWLRTTVRHLAQRVRRENRRRTAREERAARSHAESHPSAADAAARSDMHRLVVRAVTALAEPYKSTILLRYFGGLSPAEIARREGVPGPTIRSRHLRALAMLREDLSRQYDGDERAFSAALLSLAGMGEPGAAGVITTGSLVHGMLGLAVQAKIVLALVAAILVLVAGLFFGPRLFPSRDREAGAPPDETIAAQSTGRNLAPSVGRAPIESDRAPDATSSPGPTAPARPTNLSGFVTFADGRAAGPDLAVIARPVEDSFSARDLARALREPWIERTAHTDPAGRFTIEGLDPDRAYRLMAGGQGLFTTRQMLSEEFTPGCKDARVSVAVGFGTALRLRERGGLPLRSNELLLEYPAVSATVRPSDRRRLLYPDDPEVLLAGLTLDEVRDDPDQRHVWSWFVAGDDDDDLPEPVEIRLKVVGYRAESATLEFEPLSRGLAVRDLELTPQCELGFGTLDIEFPGSIAPIDPATNRLSRTGILLFQSITEEGGSSFVLPVFEASPIPTRFEGIPCGSYEVRFLSSDGFFEYPNPSGPPLLVDVGRLPAPLAVDFSAVGSVECRMLDATGAPYTGPLEVRVDRYDNLVPSTLRYSWQMDVHLFDSAPYRVDGIPRGRYRITPRIRAPEAHALDPATVIVEPQSVSTALFELPD